jgi:hypothetical protein
MLFCRTPDADEPSKATEQKSVNVLTTPSGASASTPPPLVGADLMVCSYNDTRSSAQWVLQYLESLKDAEANRQGNRSSFTARIALTAKLEAAEKVLTEERVVRQVVD